MQRKVTSLWGRSQVVLRQTPRAVTPFGGLSVFIEFLGKIGFAQQVSEHLPVRWKSPNAIPAGETFTAFVMSVLAGARRFAHSALLRADRALHALLGMKRFPTDGTMRNLFKRFTHGMVVRFYEPLWAWQLARVPKREGGYSLDLDSTVFERGWRLRADAFCRHVGVLRDGQGRRHTKRRHVCATRRALIVHENNP